LALFERHGLALAQFVPSPTAGHVKENAFAGLVANEPEPTIIDQPLDDTLHDRLLWFVVCALTHGPARDIGGFAFRRFFRQRLLDELRVGGARA
jgi:hypothetical protein